MSSKITAISKDSVHKICSGQVVLSLAVALKELIENSLDAQATAIEIRLKEYGSELIEVSDNGIGIHPSNFTALALKHHTSKINDFADLTDIKTFGFRGEALSSLCAVSNMFVSTKHTTQALAHKLIFDNMGVLQETQLTSRQVGTTVTLTNLFSSLPVRQKEFHRNLKKEFNKAVQLLSAYCLVAANVKISCVNQTKKGGRTVFLSTQNNKNIRDNITCVFGSKQLLNLLEVVHTNPNKEMLEEFGISDGCADIFKLEGYISSCEHGCGRGSSDRQFFYINSRPCDIAKVTKTTNEIYHRYNQHQYPFVLLNVIIPKQFVDVNVTPDKRLVFFENEKTLLAVIKSSLTKTFENIPSTYRLNNTQHFSNNDIKNKLPYTFVSTAAKLQKFRHPDHNDARLQESDRKRLFPENTVSSTSKQIKLDVMLSEKSNVSGDFRKSKLEKNSCTTNQDGKDRSPLNVAAALQQNYEDSIRCDSAYESGNKIKFSEEDDRRNSENCDKPDSSPRNGCHNSEVCDAIVSNLILDNDEKRLKNCRKTTFVDSDSDFDHDEQHSENLDSTVTGCDDPVPAGFIEGKKYRTLNISVGELRMSAKAKQTSASSVQNINNKFHAEINPAKNQAAEEELKKVFSKDKFCQMKIVGQFNLGFIIAKLDNDLFIIDQHAADEKYNFETLQNATTLTGQKLVVPQDLNLTVANESVLMDNIEVLRKNGFEFLVDESADATKKVKLVSIPVSRNWQFGKEDIDEMLFMLQDAPNILCRPSRIRSMFASRACRKSVMIGTALSVSDMRKLINNMGLIEHPWSCPHGRPTMRHLINLSLLK